MSDEQRSLNFIDEIIEEHARSGRFNGRVQTRFPPEPNGYLHVGHAKSICLNFGIAREFGGTCNLRMDDTNPTKEDIEYVESIQRDVHWLIDGWADGVIGLKAEPTEPFYASDYFQQLYDFAVTLIRKFSIPRNGTRVMPTRSSISFARDFSSVTMFSGAAVRASS